jgi:hypothetical protein
VVDGVSAFDDDVVLAGAAAAAGAYASSDPSPEPKTQAAIRQESMAADDIFTSKLQTGADETVHVRNNN